jgi:hypothetical protein
MVSTCIVRHIVSQAHLDTLGVRRDLEEQGAEAVFEVGFMLIAVLSLRQSELVNKQHKYLRARRQIACSSFPQ